MSGVALVVLAGSAGCAGARGGSGRDDGGQARVAASGTPDASAPTLYGPGLFSTGQWDFFLAWSPDAREVFFCRADSAFSRFDLYETGPTSAGGWRAPRRPRFAARWSNADPHVSPDGTTLFFISDRPLPADTGGARRSYDVWFARRGADGRWGDAEHLDGPVNRPRATEWSPAVTADGTLYFGTVRPGGRGGNDIWRARLAGGRYQEPENLGDSVNTGGSEIEPWVAPDESYLIFSATARTDSLGGYDLYISYRRNGVFQGARRLANDINSPALDFNPSVSPDGRHLYFSSTRPHAGPVGALFDVPGAAAAAVGIGNGQGDVYRVSMDYLGVPRP